MRMEHKPWIPNPCQYYESTDEEKSPLDAVLKHLDFPRSNPQLVKDYKRMMLQEFRFSDEPLSKKWQTRLSMVGLDSIIGQYFGPLSDWKITPIDRFLNLPESLETKGNRIQIKCPEARFALEELVGPQGVRVRMLTVRHERTFEKFHFHEDPRITFE
ncbi:MAG: hypothetical protein JWO00_378 [Candidatus Parcubacteria bacterium]|nr:hypothetical protein [Candidatus Parcubacteria bacterium]